MLIVNAIKGYYLNINTHFVISDQAYRVPVIMYHLFEEYNRKNPPITLKKFATECFDFTESRTRKEGGKAAPTSYKFKKKGVVLNSDNFCWSAAALTFLHKSDIIDSAFSAKKNSATNRRIGNANAMRIKKFKELLSLISGDKPQDDQFFTSGLSPSPVSPLPLLLTLLPRLLPTVWSKSTHVNYVQYLTEDWRDDIKDFTPSGSVTGSTEYADSVVSAKLDSLQLNDYYKKESLDFRISGLTWRDMGNERPHHGDELVNARLSKALQQTTTFTQAEWNTFTVEDLSADTFIEVEGGKYFKPAGKEYKLSHIQTQDFFDKYKRRGETLHGGVALVELEKGRLHYYCINNENNTFEIYNPNFGVPNSPTEYHLKKPLRWVFLFYTRTGGIPIDLAAHSV